ncbi:MAG TPA: double zinc ribbon domain-containing protein, partial [Pyrinomonadaceae bacterium]|nr:double zinc ribbon domain-containing protein [Pyrinomonadaceae bacterium]
MFKAVQNSLLSVVYPQECSTCAKQVDNFEDGVACSECWNATRLFNGTEMLCDKCGAYFADTAGP